MPSQGLRALGRPFLLFRLPHFNSAVSFQETLWFSARAEVSRCLLAVVVDSLKPSQETCLYADKLQITGIWYVGHSGSTVTEDLCLATTCRCILTSFSVLLWLGDGFQ